MLQRTVRAAPDNSIYMDLLTEPTAVIKSTTQETTDQSDITSLTTTEIPDGGVKSTTELGDVATTEMSEGGEESTTNTGDTDTTETSDGRKESTTDADDIVDTTTSAGSGESATDSSDIIDTTTSDGSGESTTDSSDGSEESTTDSSDLVDTTTSDGSEESTTDLGDVVDTTTSTGSGESATDFSNGSEESTTTSPETELNKIYIDIPKSSNLEMEEDVGEEVEQMTLGGSSTPISTDGTESKATSENPFISTKSPRIGRPTPVKGQTDNLDVPGGGSRTVEDEYDKFFAALASKMRRMAGIDLKKATELELNIHKMFHAVEQELL